MMQSVKADVHVYMQIYLTYQTMNIKSWPIGALCSETARKYASKQNHSFYLKIYPQPSKLKN